MELDQFPWVSNIGVMRKGQLFDTDFLVDDVQFSLEVFVVIVGADVVEELLVKIHVGHD